MTIRTIPCPLPERWRSRPRKIQKRCRNIRAYPWLDRFRVSFTPKTPRTLFLMNYVHLGRSGLQVSPLCLGTMNFGPQTTKTRQLFDHGSRAGGRCQFFRHRRRLRSEKGQGFTENIVGRWFAQGDMRRERVVIATKVFGTMEPGPENSIPIFFVAFPPVKSSMECEASVCKPFGNRLYRPLPDASH